MDTSMRVSIPTGEQPLAVTLSSMPRQFKDEAKRGFQILARIGPQDYAAILSGVFTSLETRSAPLDTMETKLKLSKSDLSALFAASMLTVSLLSEGGST